MSDFSKTPNLTLGADPRPYSKRIALLETQLAEAVSLLREGKKQFTPHTTNSDVDEFIKRYDNAMKGQDDE